MCSQKYIPFASVSTIAIACVVAMTVFLTSCFPEGDDNSVMGPGEKLVGQWLDSEIPFNTPFYIFESDGTYTSGITNCDNDTTPSQQQGTCLVEQQGTWYVEHPNLLTITPRNTPSQTLDYFADQSHLELDGHTYTRVTLSFQFDSAWSDTIHLAW